VEEGRLAWREALLLLVLGLQLTGRLPASASSPPCPLPGRIQALDVCVSVLEWGKERRIISVGI
jgi:hypothetical protein